MSANGSLQDQDFGLASAPVGFADPEWRGNRSLYDGFQQDCGLRPYRAIVEQQRRIGALIRVGEGRGQLGAYQARRAAFDLESIRAQAVHEIDRRDADDEDRRAIQSRLDRLEACLCAALRPDRGRGG